MHQWTIGAVRVTQFVELELPGIDFILPDAVPENLKSIGWLGPHFVSAEGEANACIQIFLIESQGRRILVDPGIGNGKTHRIPVWNMRNGPFLEDLAGAGVGREEVDTVLCTHVHPDHVGFNTTLVDGVWAPTFPKAEYLLGRVEWDHVQGATGLFIGSIIEESVQPVVDAGCVRLIETDHRLTDEVWVEGTPGHTPGHMSVWIASEGEEAVITGDVLHHPSQFANPQWPCSANEDEDGAQATRKVFIERCADRDILVIGTHFPPPTAGRVVRDGDGFRFLV